ncbi:MAG: hypothetical protein HPY85_17775 [Anaerolineae bacterium]|nr:hypothetical protein [Anaerolineae bacterium]
MKLNSRTTIPEGGTYAACARDLAASLRDGMAEVRVKWLAGTSKVHRGDEHWAWLMLHF